MQIFLYSNDEQTGPFTQDQVQQFLRDGLITPETFAWQEGMADWGAVREVLIQTEKAPPVPQPVPLAQVPPEEIVAFATKGEFPLARLLDQEVLVVAHPNKPSQPVRRLECGNVIELRKIWKMNKGWAEIRLPNNTLGYMPSKTKVAFLTRAQTKEKETPLFTNPTLAGSPVKLLEKNTRLWVLTKAGDAAIQVRLDSGRHGYMRNATKIKTLPPLVVSTVQSAGHDVLVGGLWCIGGIIVTAGTYAAVADTGGSYLICWGPMLFGGFQFLKGLFKCVVGEQAKDFTQVQRGAK